MKKLVLVYNPVSGKAEFKNRLDEIIDKFQQRGCVIIPYRTTPENADLADFIREMSPEGIISAGGDGTLHEMINLVMKEKLNLPIAIIGSGTSNDFATYLQLDTDEYFDRIAQGVTRRVDLGKTTQGEYFINVASAGMATAIAHEVDARLKNAIGKLAYYIRGITSLPQFKSMQLHIKTDEEELEVQAYLFLVVNSTTVASFKDVATDAYVDDGKLDLIVIKQCSMPELMAMTAELMAGKTLVGQKNILYLQSSNFEISSDTEMESDLDGELGPALPLKIETVLRCIELFV